MALNITQTVGSLRHKSLTPGSINATTSEQTAIVNAAAVWKSPQSNGRFRLQKQGGDQDLISPPVSPIPSPIRSPIRSPPSATPIRSPSPVRKPIRLDLVSVCQALTVDIDIETEHEEIGKQHRKGNGVPVFVMLPLDSVKLGHGVNRKKAMNASLHALKSAGVEGVMMDVWWGLVERAPGEYDWSDYAELLNMVKRYGLKVQAVMSFHQCGGNVGDSCLIQLPRWVVEEMEKDENLAYTDQWGRRNYEYVSLGCDELPVLRGRTPIQCYSDFMRAFRDQFKHLLSDTIVEIQVGMGPAGELRYPSYPETNGTWRFPGIGAFQCYDKYMLSNLKAAAEAIGKPEWGTWGPSDAGHYNNWPEDAPFFRHDGGWNTPYGEFFLTWYSEMLLNHGDRVLTAATSVFRQIGVKISCKIAGIHWHYGTRSHAPELTAGYYNTRHRDGYLPIARLLARHGAIFNFTCIEMRDCEQPMEAQCSPESLVRQVTAAAKEAGVALAGENALLRHDDGAHEQVLRSAFHAGHPMFAFTYLRMGPELFHPDHWRRFVGFVKKMKEGRETKKCQEEVEREAEVFMLLDPRFTKLQLHS